MDYGTTMRGIDRRLTAAAVVLALLLPAGYASAQTNTPASTSTLIELPAGTLEVLGLDRWTPEMIQDSLDHYAPGVSIESHACAGEMRQRLHFAEAAAMYLEATDSTQVYVFLPAIEPQDSGLVRHRMLPRDTTMRTSQAPWRSLVELASRQPHAVIRASLIRVAARSHGLAPEVPPRDIGHTVNFHRVWQYLDAHTSAEDAANARQQLQTSPNIYDRIVALSILTSFEDNNATWHALVATLTEEEGMARGFAGQVLNAFREHALRPIDWRPAATDLHALLNGTNLFALRDVMEVLMETGVNADYASDLLKDGGHAVLLYAGAAHPWLRDPAVQFLQGLSGREYGTDVDQWRDWIAQL